MVPHINVYEDEFYGSVTFVILCKFGKVFPKIKLHEIKKKVPNYIWSSKCKKHGDWTILFPTLNNFELPPFPLTGIHCMICHNFEN